MTKQCEKSNRSKKKLTFSSRSADETMDIEDGDIHHNVDNAMKAFSAVEAINCRNSINALFADSATIASNAQYAERFVNIPL